MYIQHILNINFSAEIKDETENGEYKSIEEEAEKLKLDINKFNEERVHIPDLNVVFRKACYVANYCELRDSNKFQLLQFLAKNSFKEIKILELEENLQLENTSLNISH